MRLLTRGKGSGEDTGYPAYPTNFFSALASRTPDPSPDQPLRFRPTFPHSDTHTLSPNMPRSNTNTPSSARAAKRHRRATISAKRAASRAGPRPLTVRDSPKDTIQKPASGSGIVHGVKKGVPRTAKAARKKERNQVYATQRAVEAAAEELLQKKGEVEMVGM